MKAKRLVSCVSALAISSAAVFTGFVSAADASYVLSYYALTSVGAEPTWDDVINTKK